MVKVYQTAYAHMNCWKNTEIRNEHWKVSNKVRENVFIRKKSKEVKMTLTT